MDLQGKTVLITGIGGCVGCRLAERAVEAGMKVRGVQRSPDHENLSGRLGIEMHQGCVTDTSLMAQMCDGVDLVVHTAAIMVGQQGNLDEFRRINVHGSLTVAKAAKASGVKTLVHLSSVVVYGLRYPNGVTEEGPFYQGSKPYYLTKLEADQQVLALNDPPNFGVVVLRPGDVYGPRSKPWVTIPLDLMKKGKFVLLNNGRGVMNHVYIDNLVDAIFLAITPQAYGQAFNITDGQSTSWKDYYVRLAALENIGPLTPINATIVKTFFRLFPQFAEGVTGDDIDTCTRRYPYSIEKARRELGYEPRISLDDGMELTGRWLHDAASDAISPSATL